MIEAARLPRSEEGTSMKDSFFDMALTPCSPSNISYSSYSIWFRARAVSSCSSGTSSTVLSSGFKSAGCSSSKLIAIELFILSSFELLTVSGSLLLRRNSLITMNKAMSTINDSEMISQVKPVGCSCNSILLVGHYLNIRVSIN